MAVTLPVTASRSAATALAAWRRRMLTRASRLTMPIPHASHAVQRMRRAETSTWPRPEHQSRGVDDQHRGHRLGGDGPTRGSATAPQRRCSTVPRSRARLHAHQGDRDPDADPRAAEFRRQADRHADDADAEPGPQARIASLLAAADRQARHDERGEPEHRERRERGRHAEGEARRCRRTGRSAGAARSPRAGRAARRATVRDAAPAATATSAGQPEAARPAAAAGPSHSDREGSRPRVARAPQHDEERQQDDDRAWVTIHLRRARARPPIRPHRGTDTHP